METAVRWSPGSIAGQEHFLFVEVVGKTFKLCRVKSRQQGRLRFEVIAEQKKVPAFRAFDWFPGHEGIVAVGQPSGEATVLRIDDGSQAALSFPVRSPRLCNAIAFNSQALLASGLDKVRTDNCLNVWDFQKQLPSGNTPGFTTGSGRMHPEPLHKLASSEPITSIKFFPSEPQSLVAGVKGQFLRLYDLREGPGTVSLQLATKCVNNLAIDPMDENYLASCHPTNHTVISIWDRRAGSRPPVAQTGFFSSSSVESTSPQASLVLKDVTEPPGSIWSMRFSNTRRGCLGLLSSSGHFKVYDFGREFRTPETINSSAKADMRPRKENQSAGASATELYLNGIQDLQHASHHGRQNGAQEDRMVSFDFMNFGGTWNEPKAITLTEDGHIAEVSIPMIPEPKAFSSLGLIHKGRKQMQKPSDLVNVILGPEQSKRPATKAKASTVRAPGATEVVAQYTRCMNGYLFSFKRNRTITSEHTRLHQFWYWLEWTRQESIAGRTVQDGLDLSYLGVYALWMDDFGRTPDKIRKPGGLSIDMSKAIEDLVQRLNIPASKTCPTSYPSHRRICLHYLKQAWTRQQLESLIDELVSQNQPTKAAAMAISADEVRLAYRALRSSSVRFHKMLAMAILSASKRAGQDGIEADDEWAETIEALANGLTDPFARAILTYVKENEWNAVIQEESLPLSYRVGIALRWLKDSPLTKYLSDLTTAVISAGNIEGIVLTGLGSDATFELLSNYLRRSGDLQTTVLALTWTIPRYINDAMTRRKFSGWRETYREYMNSWNLHFDRADFDIGSSKIAVDADGKRLWEPAKPQVVLMCGYCSREIAHFSPGKAEAEATDFGAMAGSMTTTHRSQRHPLTSDKAAAIGTICPKCGRRLPRCGVCDIELGMPDPSYLKWSARVVSRPNQHRNLGSTDLSASIGGGSSIMTTLGGPGTTGVDSSAIKPKPDPEPAAAPSARISAAKAAQQEKDEEQDQEPTGLPNKFIVYCIKCSHGFHAQHAINWFRGGNSASNDKNSSNNNNRKNNRNGVANDGPKTTSAKSKGTKVMRPGDPNAAPNATATVTATASTTITTEERRIQTQRRHSVCPVSECECRCELG